MEVLLSILPPLRVLFQARALGQKNRLRLHTKSGFDMVKWHSYDTLWWKHTPPQAGSRESRYAPISL